ncbi:hypothetical protein PVAG01_10034 [Phlyctema vagabunda]|uniref:Carbohydrate kinase PfkB domain-containing protein n=1 Tax=Phlyctema vagabunda TaxID=108571 RepID=A0ABR4P4T8_9HELO
MAGEEGIPPSQELDFCTLGMFIIDEIHYQPPTPSVHDIVGGAGAYAALGARLLSPPPLSKTVSWIVDAGSDFPESISSQLRSWETSCLIRTDPSRLTTRGWNSFDENQDRAFAYTSPKLRLTPEDLRGPLLAAKSYHLICSPTRCREIVQKLLRRRAALHLPRPILVWEPVPDLCIPSELLNLTNTLPWINVCSPNHSELAALMGDSAIDEKTGEVDKSMVERACEQLLESMPLNQNFSLVVRAGAQGCYIAQNGGIVKKAKKKRTHRLNALSPTMNTADLTSLFAGLLNDKGDYEFERRDEEEVNPGIDEWVPAYHTDASKVVDPTGGGNGFLGGLTVALARGKGLEEAAVWGSVAASLAIEQVGMPVLGSNEDGKETWNGILIDARIDELFKRI